MKKTVGNFEVDMGGPHPVLAEIKHWTGSIRVDHRELGDLEYLVRVIKAEARRMLGDRESEVI